MFRKTTEGWKRQKLIGGQTVESVEKFINDGLAMDEAEKKSAAEGDENSSSDAEQAVSRPVDATET
jgi:hypothetical protein